MSEAAKPTFDEVFVGHRRTLVRMLVRIVGSIATAEDLVHETYLRVAAALRDRRVEHLEPFLYQTARNIALDHLRAAQRHAKVVVQDMQPEDMAAVPAVTPSPEAEVGDRQLLARLDAALATLSERQQQVFVLNRIEGWSYGEIAERLDVSVSTVQKDLKAAMAACLHAFAGPGKT